VAICANCILKHNYFRRSKSQGGGGYNEPLAEDYDRGFSNAGGANDMFAGSSGQGMPSPEFSHHGASPLQSHWNRTVFSTTIHSKPKHPPLVSPQN